MTLKLNLTAQEWQGLDEGFKSLYEEKDGGYRLSVEGVEDTSGLKLTLNKVRKEADQAEKRAKSFESFGKTPEEISELLKKAEEDEVNKATRSGEWDKLKAQMNEQHTKALAEKDKVIAALKSRLEQELVDAKAVEAISEKKGVAQLLLPHVRENVRVVENDAGELVVRVMGADKTTPRLNTKGDYMTIAELVEEMSKSDVFSRAFEPSGNGGSGSKGGGGGNYSGPNPFKKETMNLTKQAELFKTSPALAERLKKEAEAS